MDDIERLLIRRESFASPRPGLPGAGAPAFVGKVVSTGASIAAGKFLLVNPVEVTGTETEGGAGAFAADTSRTVPVYLARGAPATGDYLVCRRVDHRWVAERPTAAGTTTPLAPVITGCFCTETPASLACVVTYGPGEDAHTYSNAYQSATILWYTAGVTAPGGGAAYTSGDHPPYLPADAYTGAGYYSSTSWVDDFGFEDYWRLNCVSTQWALGFGQKNLGVWQSPVQTYNWSMASAGNTCTHNQFVSGQGNVRVAAAFALTAGAPQSGVLFNGAIRITG